MKTLLRLDCSSRLHASISRELSKFFEEKWLQANPNGTVIYRDLIKSNVPHVNEAAIIGFNSAPEHMTNDLIEATEVSAGLIQELRQADEVLISSPLYNLNVPSSLKAYFDQVVRHGHTFDIDETGYHGRLTKIKAYLITVKGGVVKGTPFEKFDFQDPYLEAILNYIGISVEKLFSVEGTAHEHLAEKNKNEIKNEIRNHFKN